MKKLFVIILLGGFIVGCGNDVNDKTKTTDDKAVVAPTENSEYTQGLELVAKSDCFTCHKVSEKLVGPSYEDVAAKYTSTPQIIDSLAETVIKGSVGKWGTVPMTPHPQLSKEHASAMIKYIMSLKK